MTMALPAWTAPHFAFRLEAMAGRREDVDLLLALQDPTRAREYVARFDWNMPNPPKYIVFGIDEKIWFQNMSDEQAVLAAQTILRDIEIPLVWRTSQLEYWHH